MYGDRWLDDTYLFRSWGGMYRSNWVKDEGNWYYFRKDGTKQEDGWFKQKNTWYWMENGGKMAVGWRKINNVWHYFKSSGAMCQNESYSVKGISYEFDQNGYLKE